MSQYIVKRTLTYYVDAENESVAEGIVNCDINCEIDPEWDEFEVEEGWEEDNGSDEAYEARRDAKFDDRN